MATINVKKVRSRLTNDFENFCKDSVELLKEIRRFFTTVKKAKTSRTGMQATYLQIEMQMKSVYDEAGTLELLVFGKDEDDTTSAVSLVEQCGYTETHIAKYDERPFWRVKESTRAVLGYVERFAQKSLRPLKAYKSILHHYENLRNVIDAFKDAIKLFRTEITVYLRSDAFKKLAANPFSSIVIARNEIEGTKEQREALLEQIDAELLEERRQEKKAFSALFDKKKKKGGDSSQIDLAADDQQEEKDDADDASEVPETKDEEDGGGSESIGGDTLYEGNLEKINASVLSEVANEGVVRGGRLLRKRRATDDYAQLVAIAGGGIDDDDDDDEDVVLVKRSKTGGGEEGGQEEGEGEGEGEGKESESEEEESESEEDDDEDSESESESDEDSESGSS